MKVSIHTDVLVEMGEALATGSEPREAVAALMVAGTAELWSPALCIANAYEIVRERHGGAAGRALLELVSERIASIPLRSGMLKAIAEGADDLETVGHRSASSLAGIGAVVSRTLKPANLGSDLTCVTPEELDFAGVRDGSERPVPFLDLKAQYSRVYNEFDDRLTDIMSNTAFILGRHVQEFEDAFADLQRVEHCLGVSTGTDALHLAFMALGLGPGDEVIVPVNTFFATAESVSLTGATPIFVDSNEFFNIDVNGARQLLEREGSGRVKAIVPVHLYGQPADLDEITALASEFGLWLVEDCAQAHLAEYKGRMVGGFGSFGAFSFYPGKNLGAYGEAGALVTNDDRLFDIAHKMRAHGEATRYMHSVVGHNYRMEAVQGAALATKVKHLSDWTAARRRNAALYRDRLSDVCQLRLPPEAEFARPVYHLFVIEVDDRDALRSHLEKAGVATGLHYPVPLHLQEAYRSLGYQKGDFPTAESQAARVVSLPMYPELSESQIDRVCRAIRDYFAIN